MRRLFLLGLTIWFVGSIVSAATRSPAVAGSFYPADRGELAYQVNKFLRRAEAGPVTGEIIALIVPHAGYQYSGRIAAYGYQQLAGKSFDRVVLIGSSQAEQPFGH